MERINTLLIDEMKKVHLNFPFLPFCLYQFWEWRVNDSEKWRKKRHVCKHKSHIEIHTQFNDWHKMKICNRR